jgi:hypothetical protein
MPGLSIVEVVSIDEDCGQESGEANGDVKEHG